MSNSPENKIQNLTADIINTLVADLTDKLKVQIEKQVQADIAQKLAQIDVQRVLNEYVDRTLGTAIKTIDFPNSSIPASAIDLATFRISGNNISGGIISKFSSAGISDNATQCQLTVLDDATVIENGLVAASATIIGDLNVKGALNVHGEVDPDSEFFKDISERAAGLVKLALGKEIFAEFSQVVFDKIAREGIDLPKITLGGHELAKGNQLGYFITDSNLQKVGHLKDLVVIGESLQNNTLYVGNHRVGINTTEPAAALAIWDEEIEIVAKKRQKNVGFIGVDRNQQLVIASGGKDNIVLDPDGTVTITSLKLGTVPMQSASSKPMHDAAIGAWVINSMPEIGKPTYWVSLGGARWANGAIAT